MKIKRVIFIGVLMLGCFSLADDASTKKCLMCHKATSQTVPFISGQMSDYITSTLRDYKSQARHSDGAAHMLKYVQDLDDAAMKSLGDQFAKMDLPATADASGIDAALIAKGSSIYSSGIPAKNVRACSDCHGRNGEGSAVGQALAPRLSRQLSSFLVLQMSNYKSGLIDNQKDMSQIATQMSDDEVNAVSTFLQFNSN